MAVYTVVSKDDLDSFLSHYALGTLVSYEGIAAGVSNTNYFVTTTTGRYVLTLFEPHRVSENDLPTFIEYAQVLNHHGVPCPATMMRSDGTVVSPLCGRPAALFEVLEGAGASAATANASLCQQAGETLARMHVAAAQCRLTVTNHFGMARWKTWMGDVHDWANTQEDGLGEALKQELSFIETALFGVQAPRGLIHGDYFPDNVFFADGYLSGVIDFHFVCDDAFGYDLAIAINAWCFDENNVFQPDRMEAMMRGYQSARALDDGEKRVMPVWLRAAALRFTLSRLDEQKNWSVDRIGTPHDPMVFAARLRFFQSQDRVAL